MHPAVADPEEVPVVAVRRGSRGLGGGEVVEVHFPARHGLVARSRGIRRVSIHARAAAERLRECVRRECKVTELVSYPDIPVGVVLEDESRR
jgi:hypothetical protein